MKMVLLVCYTVLLKISTGPVLDFLLEYFLIDVMMSRKLKLPEGKERVFHLANLKEILSFQIA